jgi:hypothetical protein
VQDRCRLCVQLSIPSDFQPRKHAKNVGPELLQAPRFVDQTSDRELPDERLQFWTGGQEIVGESVELIGVEEIA